MKPRLPLWPAAYFLAFFAAAAVLAWLLGGGIPQSIFLTLIGLSVAAGLLVHAQATPRRKPLGRRLSLALVGLSLFLGAGVFGRQSFQLEGLFFYAFAGIAGGVVTHYLVAKILGPLVIGRAWCGWGCWIWMVLDYLPWKRSPGRRPGMAWLRAAHFGVSLGLVVLLVRGFGYDHGFTWRTTDGLWWFLGGCAVYYVAGFALALALKDSRAFCKYLCPVSLFLRAGGRAAILRVEGDRDACTRCRSCEKICPMDVKVAAFVNAGQRVSDPECTLCQACIVACPEANLGLSVGLGSAVRRRAALRP